MHRDCWPPKAGGRAWVCSCGKMLTPPVTQVRPPTEVGQVVERVVRNCTGGIQLTRLLEGIPRNHGQAERNLALAELQPHRATARFQIQRLLGKLQCDRKLL